jgi:hypothetical protein
MTVEILIPLKGSLDSCSPGYLKLAVWTALASREILEAASPHGMVVFVVESPCAG